MSQFSCEHYLPSPSPSAIKLYSNIQHMSSRFYVLNKIQKENSKIHLIIWVCLLHLYVYVVLNLTGTVFIKQMSKVNNIEISATLILIIVHFKRKTHAVRLKKEWKMQRQDSIPVGCIPSACQPYRRRQYGWGRRRICHKFEDISSDDHQMSVARG